MNDLLKLLGDIYIPEKALLIYRSKSESKYYIESFDMDELGQPINVHPLSTKESNALAVALDSSAELKQSFLMSKNFLPENVLYINSNRNGHAVWFTPTMKANLYFKDELSIPDGLAWVPPLLWKASKTKLHIWALDKNSKPVMDDMVYQAPFFNVGNSGTVCMGNVDIQIDPQTSLEDFMVQWQSYFFNSKFSHLLTDTSPCKQNIVQLWQNLIGTDQQFPILSLKESKLTLQSILR